MFPSLPKQNLNFSFTFVSSSANAFILDLSKILLFGRGYSNYMRIFYDFCCVFFSHGVQVQKVQRLRALIPVSCPFHAFDPMFLNEKEAKYPA